MEIIFNINKCLEQIETKVLNPIGHIPIASTPIGAVRGLLGLVETVAGIGLTILGAAIGASKKDDEYGVDQDKYELRNYGIQYLCHGVANIGRGMVEIIPILNMLTLCYDGLFDDRDSLDYEPTRFKYIQRDEDAVFV